ncbi:MAG: HDOD domain-containing protein [Verrucomicrobiota bacterium]
MSLPDIVEVEQQENLPEPLAKDSVERATQLLSEVEDIPSAPPVAFKLLSMLKKRNQNNDEVVEIIKYDANLTASVLKACNAGVYKGISEVSSIEDAVLRIGYQRLNEVVVALSVGKVINKTKRETYISPYDLWRETLRSSFAAKELVGECKALTIDPNLAFTVGLLSHMGRFALMNWPSEETLKIPELMQKDRVPYHEAEYSVLGTTSSVIGYILLEQWNLPKEMAEATYFKDFPEYSSDAEKLSYLSYMAGVCADLVDEEDPVAVFDERVPEDVMKTIGLTREGMGQVMDQMEAKATEIQGYMMVAG